MNRRNQKATTYFVILSLLIIGIVYAFLQANLQINGIAKIKSNSWDIHFNNVQINENSVSISTGDSPATIDSNNNCKIDFEVTLSLPGDFYEFTVDVVNAGTIDGMIGELNKTLKVNGEVVSEIPSYLNYVVTYDGGDEILPNHLLKAGHTLTYKVRLEFRSDIEELPEATTISTSLEPQYIQADDTAIKKPPHYACTFDGEMVQGAEYTNGQYTYRYMQEMNYYYDNSILQYVSEWHDITQDGWGVILSDASSTDPVTSRLCTSINNKPIVSMSGMFLNSQTTNIDTFSFDTSNVTNMDNMFRSCASLTTIDLSSFNTINVTNMHEMFAASGLTTLDLSNFNTTNVTNMSAMFAASSLSILDLSNFNTSNVTNMVEMFASSSSLIELNISNFDLSNSTDFVSIANGIFGNTKSLKKINMSNWKLPINMLDSIFRNGSTYSSPIEEINVTGWDLSNTTNASGMFGTGGSNGKGGTGLKKIIGLDTWNTSNITNMSAMFQGLSSLQSLDLSSFNTSNVTDISFMFNGCSKLTTLDLSSFDTTSVTNTDGMFYKASSLTTMYARTQADADMFNSAGGNPSNINFVVKT